MEAGVCVSAGLCGRRDDGLFRRVAYEAPFSWTSAFRRSADENAGTFATRTRSHSGTGGETFAHHRVDLGQAGSDPGGNGAASAEGDGGIRAANRSGVDRRAENETQETEGTASQNSDASRLHAAPAAGRPAALALMLDG